MRQSLLVWTYDSSLKRKLVKQKQAKLSKGIHWVSTRQPRSCICKRHAKKQAESGRKSTVTEAGCEANRQQVTQKVNTFLSCF